MRVIAGQYRSRQLRSLPGLKLRPTSDRLRETLFNVLAAGAVPINSSSWLDLFAGTGAIGIEALSRGAETICFVESSRKAASLIAQNLASLGVSTGFEILQCDAAEVVPRLAAQRRSFDFCFLDPPYAMAEGYTETLSSLAELTLLKPGGIAIAEHDRHFDPGESFAGSSRGLRRFRKLQQGDAVLSFYGLA